MIYRSVFFEAYTQQQLTCRLRIHTRKAAVSAAASLNGGADEKAMEMLLGCVYKFAMLFVCFFVFQLMPPDLHCFFSSRSLALPDNGWTGIGEHRNSVVLSVRGHNGIFNSSVIHNSV